MTSLCALVFISYVCFRSNTSKYVDIYTYIYIHRYIYNQNETLTSVTHEFHIFFLCSADDNDQFVFSCWWANLGRKPDKKITN